MTTHRMWHLMDETERRKWQDPEAILREIGLKSGQTLVDLGCGSGFFALPAARIVGPRGRIYGLDINVDFIAEIRRKADSEGLKNFDLKVGKAEDNLLCRSCADFVFFGIVLHDFQDPARVLQNAWQMLKPQGRLADLDWKKQAMTYGPPVSVRFSEETASQMIESAGFRVEKVSDCGPRHYLILATVGCFA